MADTLNIPKVGPVKKQYVIGVVSVAGAYVVYRWWSSRSSVPTVVDPSAGPSDFKNPDPNAPTTDIPTVTNPNVGDKPTTNAEWTAKAVADLENLGFEPGFVVTTLGKYLAGELLTLAEAALVRSAIALEGSPPNGAPNIRTTPTTPVRNDPPATLPSPRQPAPPRVTTPTPKPATPKPTPKPPTRVRTHTVRRSDTLSSIAQTYYGHGTPAYYNKIYNANAALIESVAKKNKKSSSEHGHWIYPGTVLTIP